MENADFGAGVNPDYDFRSYASFNRIRCSSSEGEFLWGRDARVRAIIKRIIYAFWPMAGSTFLFGLIMIGFIWEWPLLSLSLLLSLQLGKLLKLVWRVWWRSASVNHCVLCYSWGGSAVHICLFYDSLELLLTLCSSGEESIGIGRSWGLSRKSFWRLFGMYVVLTLILYLFLAVVQIVIAAVLGVGLGAQLLQSLVSILVMSLWFLPYVVSFFDLRVRNEGLGLQSLIDSTIPDSSVNYLPIDLDKKNEL